VGTVPAMDIMKYAVNLGRKRKSYDGG